MTKEQLCKIVPYIMEIAKANLTRDGYLTPAAIVMYGNEWDIAEIYFGDSDASKNAAAKRLRDRVDALNGDAVVLICDTWVAKIDDGAPDVLPPGKRVRDLPQAREAILVTGNMPGYEVLSICEYTKDSDDKVHFSEIENTLNTGQSSQSRFTDGLWSGTTH